MKKAVVEKTTNKLRPAGVPGRLSVARGGRTNPTLVGQMVRSGSRVMIAGRALSVDGASHPFILGPDHLAIFAWASRAPFGHGVPQRDNKKSK